VPPGPNVVFYSVLALQDELLVWRRDGKAVELERRPIGAEALNALVTSAAEELRQGSASAAASQISRALFGDRLPETGGVVVLSPDPILYALPFAALPVGKSETPLATDSELIVAPSLALWSSEPPPRGPDSHCALLVAGAPSGGTLEPGLAVLARVSDEIRAVAADYDCTREARSLQDVTSIVSRNFDVVHFAGHSVQSGDGSGSVLMVDNSNVREIGSRDLAAWPIADSTVVLSSCSTAEGRRSPTAGRDGAAFAFLAAGASSVIANLWPVDDDRAIDFSRRLHRHLARGDSPSSSLRLTQLELIKLGREPSGWAGWRVLSRGGRVIARTAVVAANQQALGGG